MTDISYQPQTQEAEASLGDYFALLKPRVMSLVVFTALVGLLAAPGVSASCHRLCFHPVCRDWGGGVGRVEYVVGRGHRRGYDADVQAPHSFWQSNPG